MMNRVVLVGRLTRDIDLRYTPSGVAVANFNMAVNRPFKNQDGEQEADFVNCVVWRKPAENLANYMKKGNLIGVDGQIQTRNYDDKDGKTIYVTEVVAGSVQFLESRNQNSGQSNQSSNNAPSKPPSNTSNNPDPFKNHGEPIDITDDDLPF